MKVEIELEARNGILIFVALLVAYFAWTTESYAWMTFMFQAAIVVAVGAVMLVLHEKARGVEIISATFSWRALGRNLLKISVMVFVLIIGVVVSITAFMLLVFLVAPEFLPLVYLAGVILGAAVAVKAYTVLEKIFEVEEQ